MEFKTETVYSQDAITAMAEGLRKTVRKKRNKRSHITGWIVIILVVILTIRAGEDRFAINSKNIITWVTTVILLIALLFEDKINGYIARKRMLSGINKSNTVFNEEKYTETTNISKSEFYYKSIQHIVENKKYFVFIFDKSHAQVFDKTNLTGGTIEEFREFLTNKTNVEITNIMK